MYGSLEILRCSLCFQWPVVHPKTNSIGYNVQCIHMEMYVCLYELNVVGPFIAKHKISIVISWVALWQLFLFPLFQPSLHPQFTQCPPALSTQKNQETILLANHAAVIAFVSIYSAHYWFTVVPVTHSMCVLHRNLINFLHDIVALAWKRLLLFSENAMCLPYQLYPCYPSYPCHPCNLFPFMPFFYNSHHLPLSRSHHISPQFSNIIAHIDAVEL